MPAVAGWIAISAGGFYQTRGSGPDREAVKGDVALISALLRNNALMQLGEWVNSDLYTGRIVRIAKQLLFKAQASITRATSLFMGRDQKSL